jgi:hypothetical protein
MAAGLQIMSLARVVTVLGVAAGLALAAVLFARIGLGPVFEAIGKIHWWEFALICLAYPLVLAADSLGWRYAFARDRTPFTRLFLARAAGEAVNAVSALAPVAGEPLRAWLVRPWVSYEDSVPSIIVAKTANVAAQTLFQAVALGLTVAFLDVDHRLVLVMLGLLAVEVVAIAVFVGTQVGGAMGRIGGLLQRFGMRGGARSASQMDRSLGAYYRRERGRFAASLGFHFLGRALGSVEALVILWALALPPSPLAAVVIEAVGSGIRFATFFVPGSLGVLEGANAGAFGALALGAGAGLAFTVLRRARQLVWIALGLAAIGVARLRVRARGRAYARPRA